MTDIDKAVEDFLAAITGATTNGDAPTPGLYVDWHELFNSDPGDEEWIAWPLIPRGRQGVVYAPAKAGKSLVVLDVVAAVASGKPILGQPNPNGRRHVLYLDYEMTAADLLERLQEMGYEPDELDHLHYALLPIIPALNTPEGAKVIRQMAAETESEVVVIDTLSRAIDGDVFHPTVIGDFYKWTGIALRADGRALWRLDHEGKDATKGMIGSVAKATDVDMVWHLKRTDTGLTLKRTHTRVLWGPDEINVTIEREPVLRHTIGPRGYAQGTNDVEKDLDRLGVPATASTRQAQVALKDAGLKHKRVAVVDACRSRREKGGLQTLINQHSGGSEPPDIHRAGTTNGNHQPENSLTSGNHLGNQQEPPARVAGSGFPPLRGEPAPTPTNLDDF